MSHTARVYDTEDLVLLGGPDGLFRLRIDSAYLKKPEIRSAFRAMEEKKNLISLRHRYRWMIDDRNKLRYWIIGNQLRIEVWTNRVLPRRMLESLGDVFLRHRSPGAWEQMTKRNPKLRQKAERRLMREKREREQSKEHQAAKVVSNRARLLKRTGMQQEVQT